MLPAEAAAAYAQRTKALQAAVVVVQARKAAVAVVASLAAAQTPMMASLLRTKME